MSRRTKFLQALEALKSTGLSMQAPWALLEQKKASDSMWWARTVGMSTSVAKTMDSQVVEFALQHFDMRDMPATSVARLFHPLRQGGLGLISSTRTAAALAASWHAAMPRVSRRFEYR